MSVFFYIGDEPVGVFLESGFNNILDAATHHPMATVSMGVNDKSIWAQLFKVSLA